MTHVLKELLGTDHPLFVRNIADLEKASGNAGVDTRLIADIIQKAHRVMRQLRLDPADSSAREVYQALTAATSSGQAEHLLHDTHYVLLRFSDGIVSFCLHDQTENAHHQLGFDERKFGHAQRHLRMEIVKRYAEHERTDNKLVHQYAKQAGFETAADNDYAAADAALRAKSNKPAPSMLFIGDIITNAFIKLAEDYAEESTDEKGYQRLTFELGAKLPYDHVDIIQAAECSPNAAVSMSRLGLKTSLMSWIGDDTPGKDMLDYLKQQGVGTHDMVVEQGMKSNYHYVLRYGADRTKLQRFEDYNYQWQVPKEKPDWIYLGVLGEDTWPLHESILKYLNENSDIKLAFQPGMYHLMWGREKLVDFYQRAEIVIMNREEAAEVTGKEREDIAGLVWALHELGVDRPVVTDGPAGAYALDNDQIWFMPNYPDPVPPLDRTGAGDAFASTMVAALALGEPMDIAMTWAPINSMSVVQKIGAQAGLVKMSELQQYLIEAPEDYKAHVFKKE